MSTPNILKKQIYWDLEPHFVYDYINFSANLRFTQTQDKRYKAFKTNQVAKAMHLVNLFETYQKSLEDLAAVVLALYRRYNRSTQCKYQSEFSSHETPIAYTLINYRNEEASLTETLLLFESDSEIISFLGISNLEKIKISLLYPDIRLNNVYSFFVLGLKDLASDQNKRLKMYNKIKHGGVVVSDGHLFSKTLPQTPAVIYADPKAYDPTDHPLTIHGFKYNDEEFELMTAGVMRVMTLIKVALSIYLVREYTEVLKTKGLSSGLEIFKRIKAKEFLKLWNGY